MKNSVSIALFGSVISDTWFRFILVVLFTNSPSPPWIPEIPRYICSANSSSCRVFEMVVILIRGGGDNMVGYLLYRVALNRPITE